MASAEDDYDYSDDEDDYVLEDDDDAMDWKALASASDNPNAAPMISGPPKSGIRIMPAEELVPEMKNRLKEVTEILDIPPAAAAVLLREFNWSKEALMEVFCSDSDNTLKKCGVYHRCNPKAPLKNPGNNCPICYDGMEAGKKLAMPCGHEFCMDCWHDYCANAIQEEGPSCVMATCPQAECGEKMTEVEVQVAAPDHLQKFQSFQLRNF
ncbi:MAG: hypothetical protein SGARI_007737, partial [Bacillariaceae sp.]